MLSISHFAEEVRRPCAFYKHYVPTARFRLDSFERTFEAKPSLCQPTPPMNRWAIIIRPLRRLFAAKPPARKKLRILSRAIYHTEWANQVARSAGTVTTPRRVTPSYVLTPSSKT